MKNTNTPDTEPLADAPVKKKKGLICLILILLLALFAAAGGSGYYMQQKQLPKQTVEAFLKDVQNMDFDGMASHLQSSDLSALDDADLRNPAFQEFFSDINKKMTYEIKKNKFDMQNGTAQITVNIRHIDGSNIYKDAVNEFLRQIVSVALSGEYFPESRTETQDKLASILAEKAGSAEDVFTETEITFPLIRENKSWKIVALDEETVGIMSANFQNAAEEIRKTFEEDSEGEASDEDAEDSEAPDTAKDSDFSGNPDTPGDSKETDTPGATANPDTSGDSKASQEGTADKANSKDDPDASSEAAPDGTTALHLVTPNFTLTGTGCKTTKDFAGKPCLLFYYDYTNTGSSPSSAMVDVNLQAFQNGEALTAAIPEKNDAAVDRFFDEAKPGETFNICQVFALNGTSEVTVEASAALGDGETASQILTVK